MKLTIESTPVVALLDGGTLCRAWSGTTPGGHAVTVYVSAIGVSEGADAEFEDALARGEVSARTDPDPRPAPAERPGGLVAIHAAAVELARSHEREAHGGAVCGHRRVAIAGCLAHCLGVKGGLVFALLERLSQAAETCPGGCGHEDTTGTEGGRCG